MRRSFSIVEILNHEREAVEVFDGGGEEERGETRGCCLAYGNLL